MYTYTSSRHGGQHRNRRLTVLSTTMLVDLNAQNERNKERERRENKRKSRKSPSVVELYILRNFPGNNFLSSLELLFEAFFAVLFF